MLLVPFSAVYESGAQRAYALLADIAIWIPAAFLWKLSSPRPARKIVLYVVACAATIEVLQLFVYSRVTSTTDVLTAGCGGVLGVRSRAGCDRGSATIGGRDRPARRRLFVLLWLLALAGWRRADGRLLVSLRLQHRVGIRAWAAPALKRVPFEAY